MCWCLEINVFKQYITDVVWDGIVRVLISIFYVVFGWFLCKQCAGIMAEISYTCVIKRLSTTGPPPLLNYTN